MITGRVWYARRVRSFFLRLLRRLMTSQATFSSRTPFCVEKKNNVEIRRNVRRVVSAVRIVRLSWQGKRALSGVVDGKLHITSPGCVWCIYIISYICRTRSVLGRFYGLDGRMGCLKTRHRYARFVDEENGFRFEGLRKDSWIYAMPA